MSSTSSEPGSYRDRDALLAEAGGRARRYLDGVADRSVVPRPEALAALDQFDFPLPDKGLDASEVLAHAVRCASVAEAVSYTHLDVYKRQELHGRRGE